jgi:hypothetical protein
MAECGEEPLVAVGGEAGVFERAANYRWGTIIVQ